MSPSTFWMPSAARCPGADGRSASETTCRISSADNGPVRVSALQPNPMHTNIRSRAFIEEAATRVPMPARTANACVHLLSPAGLAWRGEVLKDDAAKA